MADGGWIKLYRSVRANWLWENGNERYAKWWLDILMMVNHDPGKILVNGKLQIIGVGERLTSIRKLAIQWGTTPRSVSKFLDLLVEDEMITLKKSRTGGTTVKVLRYADYQQNSGEDVARVAPQKAPQKAPHSTPQPAPQVTYKQEGLKKDKKEKKSTIYSPVIDYLNQKAGTKYKSSGKNTQTLIRAREKDGFKLDDFKKVIDNKVAEWRGTDMEQYLRPITLFGTRFESYLNQKPVKPKQRQNFTQNNDQYSNLGW